MLAAGLVARPAGRTVCGMLAGAGLGGVWHHSRAHRFFAAAAWSADAVGLVVLRLVTGWLVPAGAPVVIAVDDTMFRRAGRKVHAAHWAYDGSLKVPKGGKKVSRGNTFVIAAVVAELPFLRRPVALPVAARLWRRGGPARTARGRRRGRPRTKGPRIGTPAQLAAAGPGRAATVTRYGTTASVTICERRCLWPGVFRSRPVRVIAVTDPGSRLVLLTTDMTTPAEQVITRYAGRWAIDMVFTQLAKGAVRPVGGGREHVSDLDLVVGDDHAVDEQLGELPPLLEGGGVQPGADGLAECLDAVGDGAEFQPLPSGVV